MEENSVGKLSQSPRGVQPPFLKSSPSVVGAASVAAARAGKNTAVIDHNTREQGKQRHLLLHGFNHALIAAR